MSTPSPPDPGLCGRCRHVRSQPSAKGSVFLRCGLADERPDFPRYPPLPVIECTGFETAAPPDAGDGDIPGGKDIPDAGGGDIR